MSEPVSQLIARSYGLGPALHRQVRFLDAARPEVIDQKTRAVASFNRIICALDPNHKLLPHNFAPNEKCATGPLIQHGRPQLIQLCRAGSLTPPPSSGRCDLRVGPLLFSPAPVSPSTPCFPIRSE